MVSICQHADRSVSTALIHAVAAPILEHVTHCAASEDNKPTNEMELGLIVEGMKMAEVLVFIAEEQTSELSNLRFLTWNTL
jgi:hypothetical protein